MICTVVSSCVYVAVFTVSRSQQTNAGQTVIRGFTHKQTQKWCRFTLFSTWTTNTLNLHVRTSSRARKHHSKFKSFVKCRLHVYYSSGLITFLLNFILEKSFSPWFHACTLYMHEVYFKAWPFLSSFTSCYGTCTLRVLGIRPVNRHIKTQLIKFCWKSGVFLSCSYLIIIINTAPILHCTNVTSR